MNTHLHVLEGFTNLYRIGANENLKNRIAELIRNFFEKIIDHQHQHLILFQDEKWNKKADIISFGHDIEAAWLIQEAAEAIHDHDLIEESKKVAIMLADAVKRGLDKDGGLWYEYDKISHHLNREKHWWPQAESMVGYFNAYQITHDNSYLDISLANWTFIKEHLKDATNGEWYWGITEDGSIMNEDKAGMWKCPYHNGRACIEIIKRIQTILK